MPGVKMARAAGSRAIDRPDLVTSGRVDTWADMDDPNSRIVGLRNLLDAHIEAEADNVVPMAHVFAGCFEVLDAVTAASPYGLLAEWDGGWLTASDLSSLYLRLAAERVEPSDVRISLNDPDAEQVARERQGMDAEANYG